MLALITTVKLIAEIALLALMGQCLLGLLVGSGRERNFFYQILRITGKPFVLLTRLICPVFVRDRQLPMVAFLVLVLVWLGATMLKILTCLQMGVNLCK